MDISIKRRWLLYKSRLAGFFLSSVLLACTPPVEPVPGDLEYTRAQQALLADLPIKATEHLELAIRQGHPTAIAQWLRLTQSRLGPLEQYQRLSAWSAPGAIADHAAALGLWQEKGALLPVLTAGLQQQTCQLRLQPVLTTMVSISHWQRLMTDWPLSDFAALPVCVLPPILLDSRQLNCSELPGRRIDCAAEGLVDVVMQSKAQILVVAAGRGQASYNNGWLQLPENFAPALFRHEFSHALGFLDEYALQPAVAAAECVRTDVLANLLLKPDDVPRYAVHWGVAPAELRLTPVDTCLHAGIQAWRPVQEDTHMQHFELAIPELYQHIMKQQLAQNHLVMPVQYYFAYLARQQKDMRRWQLLMQQSASFGYPAAQAALHDAGLSSTAR